MPFEPVAIVGQSCVLPGALNPDELWRAIASGKDLLSDAPPGYWRTAPRFVESCCQQVAKDISWTNRGGYVRGFESVFDPKGYSIPVEEIAKYGTLVHWLLHTAREALRDAGLENARGQKAGIIFGNLSYPSHAMSEYAEAVWLDMQGSKFVNGKARELARVKKPHPLNRFMSGLPAHMVAQALELNTASFAIDAACASSLYAIKLACDKLHDRTADLMLAGGINASDDLILHIGFCTLQAMSQTGKSRPFHKEADGLVPAQGAGFLSLKRLDDAVQNGDHIHAVIRAVGLSNDGSGQGLLVPSLEGQLEAMQKAYEMSCVDPSEINLLECHATGTKVGDAIEIASSSRIFEGLRDIPIGTVKSNMGHPITASGIAGIIKVTGAMKAGIRPRTLHVAELNDALAGSPFRVLKESEPWPESPKRMAGISNFGFGGNNAHLILEKWDSQAHKISTKCKPVVKAEIAVIGMGAIVASDTGIENFAKTIFSGKSVLSMQDDGRMAGKTDSIDLPILDLNFFPAALDQTLPQQLAILKATLEAVEEVSILPRKQTGVFVGMGCDGEVTRSGMCWRLAQFVCHWLDTKEVTPEIRQWIECVKDEKINPARDASAILGAMPNVVANRINSQFDFQGPSFTVSSEELSGVRSLEIAMRALRSKEIDAAVVGAVDLSCEPVHMSAVQETLDENRQIPGDAAIALVLKRVEDARRDGDKIYALLDGDSDRHPMFKMSLDHRNQSITPLVGHAHAASGLLHIVAAVLACHYRCLPSGAGVKAVPFVLPRPLSARIDIRATGKQMSSIVLKEDVKTPPGRLQLDVVPKLHMYSGKNRVNGKNNLKVGKSNQCIMRRYNVHPPKIQLPPVEIHQNKMESGLNRITRTDFEPKGPSFGSDGERADEKQLMQPAPRLPPIMAGEGHMINESSLPAEIAFEKITESENRDMGKVSGMKNIIKSIIDQNGMISEIHQSFIKEHAKLQKRFLESSQNALAMLNHMDQYVSFKASPEIASFPIPSQAQKQMPKEREFSKPHLVPPPIIQKKPLPIDKDIKENHAPRSIAPDLQEAPLTSAAENIDPVKARFRNPVYLEPNGPQFSKEKLEILASGKISDVFGEMFAIQDDFTRQVRLPEYPLLLADRITGLQAEPGSMDQGIIWTETDVTENAWYLNDMYMPAGITVESGQCDLTLISYLGADFQNKGKRVYRLLGCDLMYYGDPPRVGDTLCYQIHVDGHANIGETRIFFFHYDCRINGELRLSVRNAQAGFFSDKELANSGGVLWDPCTGEHKPDSQAKVEPPVVVCSRKAFSIEQVKAFSLGNVYACFGPGFELACTHSKTPKIQSGMMLLIDKVTELDPKGGPWGRGYLRIENKIPADAWYLTCHFKNDPCMPGTLMSDACLQALAFYMTAMGFTLNRDGWRFDPVPDEVIQCRCRGQVIPESEDLIYEVFVDEVEMVDGLYPTIFADILATCDGLKILHMRHMGLRLVPDWPLDCWPHLLKGHKEKRTVANIKEMHFGYHSLLACAFGKPSDAFGELGELFDNGRHISRLPGPPYHFMSRVSRIDADMGAMKSGQTIEVEYDVPRSEWYFKNNHHTMPFCVLMEVALQPCGWLAVFEGGPNTSNEPLYFRNLDGTGTISKEIVPDTGILKTRTTLTNIANIAGVTLVNFDVKLFVDDEPVYNMTTGFGFFKKEALANQVGLAASEADIMWLDEPNDFHVELTDRPAKYFGGKLKLPGPMLLMIDRITGFWPDWGEKSLGRLRAEKTVDINEWFFKAHFFHDPVQPGSLGVEAIIQTLEFYMIHQEMHKGFKNPCFESIAKNNPVTWKYRGQVTPDKKRISIELNILDKGQNENGVYAVAEGWLWVDELRIFNVKNLRINIKEGIEPTIDDLILEQVVDLTGVDPAGVDSGQVHFIEDKNAAICQSMPFTLFPVVKSDHENGGPVIEIKEPCLDFDRIIAYGRKNVGVEEPWAGENILLGLCRQFTRRLIVDDVDSIEKTKGRSVLFLGNHQVQVESLLFPMLIQVLSERRVVTIAGSVHQKGWVGMLNDLWYAYPGVNFPKHIVYFDQNDRKSMFNILKYLKSRVLEDGISIFLHVEGKLGLSCRKPVSKMSSVFIDLSQDMKLPIVPVRFSGGLPIDKMKKTIDFPIGYGKQDYHVGRPISCEEIESLPYAERRKHVINAINDLGPSHEREMPHRPDTAFEKSVKNRIKVKNVSEVQAVIFKALENATGDKDIDALRLLEKDRNSRMRFANDEKGLWLSKMARFLYDLDLA